MALALMLTTLIGVALLRLPSGLIAVAGLGGPLLFLLYLTQTGILRGISRHALIAVVLGAGIGVGWAVLAGEAVARSYRVPLVEGITVYRLMRSGVGVTLTGLLLIIVPATVVRLLRPSARESLDGFVIGVLGALGFTTGVTLTRLGPQFATGVITYDRPLRGLLIEAGICGVTVPVTFAAVGGLIGILLWFNGPSRVRASIAGVLLLIYGTVGVIDLIRATQTPLLFARGLLTVAALVALRVGMHLALLREAHGQITVEPRLCAYCERVVPDMAFCPACGVATRASSRSSRRQRRARPMPTETQDRRYTGYALPSDLYFAAEIPRTSYRGLLGTWTSGIAAATAALVGVSLLVIRTPTHHICPPECGHPPVGIPMAVLPRFTASDGAFSVLYPAPGSAYDISTDGDGVTARFTAGDGGTMRLFARRADGRAPQDIAAALVTEAFPEARVAYQIPNAMVGYQPGFGEVADAWPPGPVAGFRRIRTVVLVSVKNDLALVAWASGPYHEFGPDFGPGPPSGTNLQLALDMGGYVNSFSWRGDPPR